MKWIKDPDTYNSDVLALSPETAKSIAELLQPVRRAVVKKWEHYNSLHEAGEATDRQQTLMFKYATQVELIDAFTNCIK